MSPTQSAQRSQKRRRPGRPVDGNSDETRRQLIDAAIQCFSANGLARTTLREIADEAGLTTGTLYHHFATKSSLYIQAYEWAVVHLYERFEEAIAGTTALHDRILIMVQTEAEMIVKGSPLNHFVLRSWVEHPSDVPPLPVPQSVLDFYDRLVDDAIAAGEVTEPERRQVQNMIRACLWGVNAISLTGFTNVAPTVEGIERFLLASLEQRPKPRRRRS